MRAKIIRGGTVVTSTDTVKSDVLIEAGRVAALGDLPEIDAEIIDARGCLILPGCIDSHTHLIEACADGFARDDFDVGTQAAAVGGTTCVIDFVIQQGPNGLRSSFGDWMHRAELGAHIDFGFHVAVTHWDEATRRDIPKLVEEGVSSFKAFMAPAGVPRVSDGVLLALLAEAKEHGALTMVHAENGDAIDYFVAQAKAECQTAPITHALVRPEWTEAEATSRAIWLSASMDAPLFVVHVSCGTAVEQIAGARARGLPVAAETCTHYLTLSTDDLRRPAKEAVRYVCSPPLRDQGNHDLLWNALGSGLLQSVSSDHCPFRDAQKQRGLSDFSLVPPGLAGIQHRLPLLWHHGVRPGRITPNRLVELTSTAAARMFGLYPRKGVVAVGADADLVVFDPDRPYELTRSKALMNVDYDLWEGRIVAGSPRITLSRGDVVYCDGRITSTSGRGRFVRRTQIDPGVLARG